MNDLAKWVWLIILIGCTAGTSIVYYIAAALLGVLIYYIYKKMRSGFEQSKKELEEQLRHDNKIKELDNLKESHPSGVQFEFSDMYGLPCIGFCWLVFGKTGWRPEVLENRFFRIGCVISQDFEAIVVSIKNYTKGAISIDYNTFRLNNERIGVDKTKDSLGPQEEATWSLRPFRKGGLSVYLDKKEIVKNEMRCDIQFSILFEDKTTRSFEFNLYTQTKVV